MNIFHDTIYIDPADTATSWEVFVPRHYIAFHRSYSICNVIVEALSDQYFTEYGVSNGSTNGLHRYATFTESNMESVAEGLTEPESNATFIGKSYNLIGFLFKFQPLSWEFNNFFTITVTFDAKDNENEINASSLGVDEEPLGEHTRCVFTFRKSELGASTFWSYPNRQLTSAELDDEITLDHSEHSVLATTDDFSSLNTTGIATAVWIHPDRKLTSAVLDDEITEHHEEHDSLAIVGSEMTLTSDYDAAKTASQFDASENTVLVHVDSINNIRDGLSSFNFEENPVLLNEAQHNAILTAISTGFKAIPSPSTISGKVWEEWGNSYKDTLVEDIFKTDISDITVEEDEYTLKHLIMASQRSEVITVGSTTYWRILDNQVDGNERPVVIATRTLTLNTKGAIVKTE